jgi:hypothetical protein
MGKVRVVRTLPPALVAVNTPMLLPNPNGDYSA